MHVVAICLISESNLQMFTLRNFASIFYAYLFFHLSGIFYACRCTSYFLLVCQMLISCLSFSQVPFFPIFFQSFLYFIFLHLSGIWGPLCTSLHVLLSPSLPDVDSLLIFFPQVFYPFLKYFSMIIFLHLSGVWGLLCTSLHILLSPSFPDVDSLLIFFP